MYARDMETIVSSSILDPLDEVSNTAAKRELDTPATLTRGIQPQLQTKGAMSAPVLTYPTGHFS